MARDDLFSAPAEIQPEAAAAPAPDTYRSQPLAARMRPRNLDEYAGQSHILGQGLRYRCRFGSQSRGAGAISALGGI